MCFKIADLSLFFCCTYLLYRVVVLMFADVLLVQNLDKAGQPPDNDDDDDEDDDDDGDENRNGEDGTNNSDVLLVRMQI